MCKGICTVALLYQYVSCVPVTYQTILSFPSESVAAESVKMPNLLFSIPVINAYIYFRYSSKHDKHSEKVTKAAHMLH